MIRGVLLDFYGTVVEEDDEVIASITARVAADRPDRTATEIGTMWLRGFAAATAATASGGFRPQRVLAVSSLAEVLAEVGSDLDADVLCAPQLAFWRAPGLRPGSRSFLDRCPVPFCVVSNIDRSDIAAAIAHHGLDVPLLVTSEDVGAYKPLAAMFEAALDLLGLPASDVLHVGDSLTSDVAGAGALGIRTAWVDRGRRTPPDGARIDHRITDLRELLPALGAGV